MNTKYKQRTTIIRPTFSPPRISQNKKTTRDEEIILKT